MAGNPLYLPSPYKITTSHPVELKKAANYLSQTLRWKLGS